MENHLEKMFCTNPVTSGPGPIDGEEHQLTDTLWCRGGTLWTVTVVPLWDTIYPARTCYVCPPVCISLCSSPVLYTVHVVCPVFYLSWPVCACVYVLLAIREVCVYFYTQHLVHVVLHISYCIQLFICNRGSRNYAIMHAHMVIYLHKIPPSAWLDKQCIVDLILHICPTLCERLSTNLYLFSIIFCTSLNSTCLHFERH